MDYVLRPLDGDADRDAVGRLLRTEFDVQPGAGETYARLFRDLITRDRFVTAGCSWVGVIDDCVVGHALMAPRTIRLGASACPAVLVGLVVVAPEARGRGIGSALVGKLEAQAVDAGAAMSILAGDPGFYGRLGYVDGYTTSRVTTSLTDVDREGDPTLAEVEPDDVEALADLSARHGDQGSVVRNNDLWRWLLETRHPAGLAERNDRILGLRAESDAFLVLREAGAAAGTARLAGSGETAILYDAVTGLEYGAALNAGVRRFAAQSGFRRLVYAVSPVSAVGEAARLPKEPFGSDPQTMVKVLDWSCVFEAIGEGSEQRVARSGAAGWREELVVRTDGAHIHLDRSDGVLRIRVSRDAPNRGAEQIYVPAIGLARAVLGRDRLGEMIGRKFPEQRDAARVIDVVLPERRPWFAIADAI